MYLVKQRSEPNREPLHKLIVIDVFVESHFDARLTKYQSVNTFCLEDTDNSKPPHRMPHGECQVLTNKEENDATFYYSLVYFVLIYISYVDVTLV